MRLVPFAMLLVVCCVGTTGLGCRRKGDCNKACANLIDLARKDVASQKLPDDVKQKILAQIDASRDSDLQTCTSRCANGSYDAACIEAITKIEDFDKCKSK